MVTYSSVIATCEMDAQWEDAVHLLRWRIKLTRVLFDVMLMCNLPRLVTTTAILPY